jgi:hypothetical protein
MDPGVVMQVLVVVDGKLSIVDCERLPRGADRSTRGSEVVEAILSILDFKDARERTESDADQSRDGDPNHGHGPGDGRIPEASEDQPRDSPNPVRRAAPDLGDGRKRA